MPTETPIGEAIRVMAELRGARGCPWDREQTHSSLARYAIEEAFEVAEAAEAGTVEDLREELGDLLLQVIFHAQIATEAGAFTIDDVATTLVDKLHRRHPHVYAGSTAQTAAEVENTWAEIKKRENPGAHPLAGIPEALPALMRAQKILSRAEKAGLEGLHAPTDPNEGAAETPASIGRDLLEVVRRAQASGIDAEQALRQATRPLESQFDLPPHQ